MLSRRHLSLFSVAVWSVAPQLLVGCGGGDLAPVLDARMDGRPVRVDGGSAARDRGAGPQDAAAGDLAGAPVAVLSIAGAPAVAFQAVVGGVADERTITVDNAGETVASALVCTVGAPFAFKGGSYPGTGGTCGATLAAAENCTVVVSFRPAAAGESTGTLSVEYRDGQRDQRAQRTLVGGATRPAQLAISGAPAHSFGSGVVGAKIEHTFTVDNTGGTEATALTASALGAPFAFKGGSYPGGGSCTTALAAGASCTLVVVYAPSDAAASTATLRLGYHDGATARQAEVALAGSGVTPAALSISDGARYDFGPRALGTSVEKALTISNSGAAGATALSAEALGNGFGFKGGSYPGTGGTCGSTLAGLASCTVVLAFAPTVAGEATATLSLLYATGAGNSGATRALVGRGLSLAALVYDAGVGFDYGTLAAGARVERAFVMTNLGELTATAIAPTAGPATPFAYSGGSYPGSGGTCGATLAPFASCTLVVSYQAPPSGSHVSAATLSYHDGVESKVTALQLRAAATAAAFLVLSDGPSHDFGTIAVGTRRAHSFTVANTGALSATGMLPGALAASFTLIGGYPGEGGDCGTTLAAGATCTIVASFAPTAAGVASGALSLLYHDGVEPREATRALSGTGTGDAALAFAGAPSRDLGRQATGSTREVTLSVLNSGALATVGALRSTVALAAGFSFKGGAFPGTGGTCGPQLAAAASCTVVLTFAPLVNGPASARIVLAYTAAGGERSAELGLTGLGVAPAALSISAGPSYAFGTQTIGSTTRKQLTVVNEGGVTATALAFGGLAAPFAYVAGSCGATLDPSASCTFAVDYQPSAAGDHADTVLLDFSDGAATRQTTRALTGSATLPALLTISDGPTLKFGARATGSVSEATLTVTNGGASNATALSVAALGAPFAFKGGAYPGTGGTCTAALAPGAGCLVIVTFAPSSVGGFDDTLTLDYHDGAVARSAQRALSGAGLPPARIELSAIPGRDLGPQATGSTSTIQLSLRNSGGVEATGLSQTGLGAPFSLSDTDCGATLAAGESCQSLISFAPTALGEASAELVVDYGNGVSTQRVRYGVQGRGAAPALIAISDRPSYDFGTLGLGTRAEHIFVVANGGGVAATRLRALDLTLPFAFKGGSYPGLGGSCAESLPAGASCTLVVVFAPAATGAATENLALSYHDGVEAVAAGCGLQGQGTQQAALAITDYPQEYYQQYGLPVDGAVHDFGRRGIGRATAHTFVVTNNGAATATAVSGAALTAGFAYAGGTGFPGQGGSCATSLAAGASCAVVVAFAPAAAVSYAASLTLTYQDGVAARTATRGLVGTGVATAVLALADFDNGVLLGASYDYGTSGLARATSHSFYLSNGGAVAATALAGTLSPSFVFHGGSYPGTGGTCGATLAAGEQCLVVADFVPAAAGLATGTLTMAYHDGVGAQSATRPLRGTGTAGPALVVAEEHGYPLPSSFDFGVVGVGRRLVARFIVLNVGAQRASGLVTGTTGAAFLREEVRPADAPTRFEDPPACPAGDLAAGASCSVWVVFTPPAAGGHHGSLVASYGDGAGGAFNAARALNGSGTAQALLELVDYAERTEPQREPHDFGTVGIGRARDFGFYLRNRGAQTATGLAVTGLAAPFSLPGGYPGYGAPVSAPPCGVQLAAGATCGLVVRFAPSASLTSSATLSLQYHDGSANRTAGRELLGAGTARALLRVADYPDGWADERPFDFGQRGQALDHTFYLINDGAVAATLADGDALAGDFGWKGGAFPGQGATCGGAALEPGQQCTVVVTFNPTGDGARTGRVGVRYTDASGDREATRELSGEATSAAVIAIQQWEGQTHVTTSYDFGVVAAPRDNTFYLVNIGRSVTTISNGAAPTGEFTYKGGAFPGSGGDCVDGATLAAGASCRIVVRFAPLGTGPRTSALRIDWGVGRQTTMQLTGTGTARGLIGITPYLGPPGGGPARLDFGTVGVPLERTLYVHNLGLRDVELSGGAPGGAFTYAGGAFPGTGGTCGTLAALSAEPCRLVVRFTPSGSGAVAGMLSVQYDDGLGAQTAFVELQGTATERARLLVTEQGDPFGCGDECGSFEFGNVASSADGSSAVARTLQVFNLGALPATALGPAASSPAGPHFRYAGGAFPGTGGTCAATLAPSATEGCSIVVELAPRAAGLFSDRVTLTGADGVGGSTQAGRNLRGSGTAP